MGAHYPVMKEESISLLSPQDGKTYVDCTLGRAGHASELLRAIPHGRLIAFDLDEEAIGESREKLSQIGDNFTLVHSSFANIAEELSHLGISKVDGIFADLGVSSPQFDDPSRGFSYRFDSRLDMRMDETSSLSAYEVVNRYKEEELARIIFENGEDRDARRIARQIARRRETKPIETTFELVEAIKAAKTAKELSKKGHPAKQTFQAIRIEVNQEEEALKRLLEVGPNLLNEDGRMAIITFMSLDDRLVKRSFHSLCVEEGSRHDIRLPERKEFALLTKKPILPSDKELLENPRSASAKLRGIRKKKEEEQ